jgi:hypothetical protein
LFLKIYDDLRRIGDDSDGGVGRGFDENLVDE